jgi:hypothetical protein
MKELKNATLDNASLQHLLTAIRHAAGHRPC